MRFGRDIYLPCDERPLHLDKGLNSSSKGFVDAEYEGLRAHERK